MGNVINKQARIDIPQKYKGGTGGSGRESTNHNNRGHSHLFGRIFPNFWNFVLATFEGPRGWKSLTVGMYS